MHLRSSWGGDVGGALTLTTLHSSKNLSVLKCKSFGGWRHLLIQSGLDNFSIVRGPLEIPWARSQFLPGGNAPREFLGEGLLWSLSLWQSSIDPSSPCCLGSHLLSKSPQPPSFLLLLGRALQKHLCSWEGW